MGPAGALPLAAGTQQSTSGPGAIPEHRQKDFTPFLTEIPQPVYSWFPTPFYLLLLIQQIHRGHWKTGRMIILVQLLQLVCWAKDLITLGEDDLTSHYLTHL